jgi:hypothetical protein
MFKAIVFFVLGMSVMYLHQNPNDFDGLVDGFRGAINSTGQFIVDSTDKSTVDKLKDSIQ